MNTVSCRQCGFTNSAYAEKCRKCSVKMRNTLDYLLNPATKGKRKKISYFQIFKNDYLMFICACFPILMWAIYIWLSITGLPETNGKELTANEIIVIYQIILAVSILLTFLGIVLIYHRIKNIRITLATGEFVIGVVCFVEFESDRGRVEYCYKFKEEILHSGSAIMKNSYTKDFKVGDEIVLVVNQKRPKRALIADLFFN